MSKLPRVTPKVGGMYYIQFSRFGRCGYSWLTLERLSGTDQSWLMGNSGHVFIKHGDAVICLQTDITTACYSAEHLKGVSSRSVIEPLNGSNKENSVRSAIFLWNEKVIILSLDCISVDDPGEWRGDPD